jgi:hypothetical protein
MHHRCVTNDDHGDDRCWWTELVIDCLPSEKIESSSCHLYSNMLYTTAHVFNFVNTVMYWGVVVPHAKSANGELTRTRWLNSFFVAHMYGVTSLIAFIEVMFLNTIKHHHVSLPSLTARGHS